MNGLDWDDPQVLMALWSVGGVAALFLLIGGVALVNRLGRRSARSAHRGRPAAKQRHQQRTEHRTGGVRKHVVR